MYTSIDPSDVRSWQPGPNVTGMGGKPLASGRDFFIQPPTQIGPVHKAYSEVIVGQTLLPIPVRIALATVMTLVGIAALVWFTHNTGQKKADWPHLFAFLGGVSLLVFAFIVLCHQKVLGYIGTDGVAVYRTRGGRSDAKAQIVRFSDIADAQTKVRQHRKGVTSWATHFRDAQGRRLLSFRGSIKKWIGGTRVVGPYHLSEGIGNEHNAWLKAQGRVPVIHRI